MYKVDILETKTSTMHKEQIILANKTKTASKTVAQLHSCEAFFKFFFYIYLVKFALPLI